MAVVINGTTGITSVNGSASAPSVTGTDTDTGIVYGTNTLSLSTGGTTAVTVDSSQNVGIGTSSPAASNKLQVLSTVADQGAAVGGVTRQVRISYDNTGNYGKINAADYGTGQTDMKYEALNHIFGAGIFSAPERMRITSAGNVGIGTDAPAINSSGKTLHIHAAGTNQWSLLHTTNGETGAGAADGTIFGQIGLDTYAFNYDVGNFYIGTSATIRATVDSSGNLLVGTTSINTLNTRFSLKNAGTTVWGVGPTNASATFFVANSSGTGVYLTDGGTSWTSNSDERLKTALTPFENAAEKVSSLRAGIGRYLKDDETVSRSFLIAQDVQAVLPEAVSTHKIEGDDTEYLGLSYTDVIPLLVAAIQEQQAIIEQLRADVEALKAK